MKATSTLSTKGQTVIPAEIRHRLGAKQGDQIIFTVVDDNTVTLQVAKRQSLTSLVGILPATRDYEDPTEYRRQVYEAKARSRYQDNGHE